MLLLEEARAVNHAEPSSGKNRFGVSDTVGLEPRQALKERRIQLGQPNFCVYRKYRLQVLGPQPPAAGLFKLPLEFRHSIGGQTEPRCLGMAAIALEETADFGQGVEEMKPRNRAAGAVREAVFKSHDQCGAVIALSHLLGNN